MFCAGFHDINSCRLDAGMTEQVRQFRDIFFEVVKCPRKQVPQVVEENFLPGHISALAQGFEQFPDRYAAQRLANTGKKHRTGMNAVFLAPAGQPVAGLGRSKIPWHLPLQRIGCLSRRRFAVITQSRDAEPVEQSASSSSWVRLLPAARAAFSRRKYSARVSSRPGSAKILRWCLSGLALPATLSMLSWQSLTAASIAFTVAGV